MSSGPPRRGLIDTPLLLAMRGGDPDAVRFATDLLRYYQIEVSELSAMALIVRCQDTTELQGEVRFLAHCRVHRITAPISRRAFRILETLPPPCGWTADDALVAATAIEHKLPLYTLDPARCAGVVGLTATQQY